jgi:integrase
MTPSTTLPEAIAPATLRERLDEYLAMRRALGFQLNDVERQVGGFCTWLAARGQTQTFTIDEAVTWARLNQADLDALLAACDTVFSDERIAATVRTVIGLLAATGLRIGEALNLRVDDIDPVNDVLVIKAAKSVERLVPIHPSTTTALEQYIALPARAATHPDPHGPVFVTANGTGYVYVTFQSRFKRVREAAGLTPRGKARPRLHDLRHTFATAHMTAAYSHGGDPDRVLSLLATWLGHSDAAHTYWYLTATGELMALAAGRLEPNACIVQGEPA